jgi:membrane DNA delivery protein
MTEFWNSVVTIAIAIIGIAGLAVIVSKQSNTSGVLTAGGSAASSFLSTALSPVTGNQSNFGGFSNTGASFL